MKINEAKKSAAEPGGNVKYVSAAFAASYIYSRPTHTLFLRLQPDFQAKESYSNVASYTTLKYLAILNTIQNIKEI